MEKDKRRYILNDLMKSDFITDADCKILLKEYEESGESELEILLLSDENLLIANVDKKKTELSLFQEEKSKSMYKRVDHMIFECQKDNSWKLHLIEMKGSVGERKWMDIKGKFRASYLLAKAIAGMLELNITETVMYTTFERVEFKCPDTMPVSRRGFIGGPFVRMQEEWDGNRFGLNFGMRIPFLHIPIQMKRNENGVLVGSLSESDRCRYIL